MKKVTFFAAAIALLGLTSMEANAQASTQEAQTQTTQTQQAQQDNREKISRDELPERVQTVLNHETYSAWTVGDIYKIKPTEGAQNEKVVYEIQMTNAEGQVGALRLDEEGRAASTEE